MSKASRQGVAYVLAMALVGCGGGGSSSPTAATPTPAPAPAPAPAPSPAPASTAPAVKSISVSPLKYGATTTVTVTGENLTGNETLETTQCTNLTAVAGGTSTQRQYTCTITTSGPLTVAVKNVSGSSLYSAPSQSVPNPQVTMVTTMGAIVVELDPAKAPVSVDNFLKYVNAGAYDGTIFHRVIAGFVVQGGGYKPGMTAITKNAAIALESQNGLSNTAYTIAMARTSVPNSATSEFYFNLVDNSASLDYKSASNPGYAVFGKVVAGTDAIGRMAAVKTGTYLVNSLPYADVPSTNIALNAAAQTQ